MQQKLPIPLHSIVTQINICNITWKVFIQKDDQLQHIDDSYSIDFPVEMVVKPADAVSFS